MQRDNFDGEDRMIEFCSKKRMAVIIVLLIGYAILVDVHSRARVQRAGTCEKFHGFCFDRKTCISCQVQERKCRKVSGGCQTLDISSSKM